jgi:hypothetical protein
MRKRRESHSSVKLTITLSAVSFYLFIAFLHTHTHTLVQSLMHVHRNFLYATSQWRSLDEKLLSFHDQCDFVGIINKNCVCVFRRCYHQQMTSHWSELKRIYVEATVFKLHSFNGHHTRTLFLLFYEFIVRELTNNFPSLFLLLSLSHPLVLIKLLSNKSNSRTMHWHEVDGAKRKGVRLCVLRNFSTRSMSNKLCKHFIFLFLVPHLFTWVAVIERQRESYRNGGKRLTPDVERERNEKRS